MTGLDIAGEMGGRVAGGILGGVIGSVFGPVGTWIGRAVGSRVGALAGKAAGAALADMMENADEAAETDTKEGEASEVCKDCAQVKCFEMPSGLTPEQQQEFRDQLKRQEDMINGRDPADLANAIRNYRRPPNDARLRQQTRDAYRLRRLKELERLYVGQSDGAARAAREVAQEMGRLDATHALDLIAGGDPTDLSMGDRSVNRSIGAQWKGGRRDQLLKHADEAAAQGKKNNVKLEICPGKGGSNPQSNQVGSGPGSAGTGAGQSGPPPTS
jgi:hypothetical protein